MIAGMNLPLASAADPTSHVIPHPVTEPLFNVEFPDTHMPSLHIFDGVYEFAITNHLLMTLVSGIAVIVVFKFVAGRVRVQGEGLDAYRTRGRFAQIFETMCSFMRDEVVRPNLHELTTNAFITGRSFRSVCERMGWSHRLHGLLGGYMFGINDPHLTHLGGTATGNLC